MNGGNMNMVNGEFHQPWLSIIMPIYNAEKYLRKCLNSILEQTYTNYEVLLIDDGSTDTSSEICQNYSSNDSRFRYIRKENGGSYQSRIYGAERASGTYIAFCDADDYYVSRYAFARLHGEIAKSNCCAMQFGHIKKYNHLSCKSAEVSAPIDVDRNCFLAQEYPKLLCSFWKGSHISTNLWSKVYHRSLISNLPSSESAERLFWGEDQIMNLHLLSTCESFRFIPDPIYCYRQLSGGTNGFSRNAMKDLDIIKKYQLRFWERYQGGSRDLIRNILFSEVAGWFFAYVQQALDNLNEAELITLINETLQYPHFILARNYYLTETEESWDAVDLLRKGDAREYIQKAKEYHDHRSVKDTIIQFLKKIYASI
ncbi:MAG: glycosyltransferase family 2 protein [Oscillospiraceae bacterium]|nr:glycosyltransferase family 2 protein [Oscillospiraceae bacterium]